MSDSLWELVINLTLFLVVFGTGLLYGHSYGYQRGFKKAVCQVPETAMDLSKVLPYGAVYILDAMFPEGHEDNRSWVVMISRIVRGFPCAAEVYRSTQELPPRFIVTDEGIVAYNPVVETGFQPHGS